MGCDVDSIWFSRDDLARPAYPDGTEAAPVVEHLLHTLTQRSDTGDVPWGALLRAAHHEGFGPLNVLAALTLLEASGTVRLSRGGTALAVTTPRT